MRRLPRRHPSRPQTCRPDRFRGLSINPVYSSTAPSRHRSRLRSASSSALSSGRILAARWDRSNWITYAITARQAHPPSLIQRRTRHRSADPSQVLRAPEPEHRSPRRRESRHLKSRNEQGASSRTPNESAPVTIAGRFPVRRPIRRPAAEGNNRGSSSEECFCPERKKVVYTAYYRAETPHNSRKDPRISCF